MIVDCAVYRDGKRQGGRLDLEDAFEAAAEPGAFVWIGLHEPSTEEFEAVAKEFELHPLVVEDAVNAHQRPKVEVYDHVVLVVLKTARYDAATEQIDVAELLLIVGDRFVVTVRHGTASALSRRAAGRSRPTWRSCAAGRRPSCTRCATGWSTTTSRWSTRSTSPVQQVEADVFSDGPAQPGRAHLRAQAPGPRPAPEHRAADGGARADGARPPPAQPSRAARVLPGRGGPPPRVVGRIDITRELLTDVLDANLAQISVRQNDDMRTISAWAAVIAVPTLLAGIWGMNFSQMPELDWWHRLPARPGHDRRRRRRGAPHAQAGGLAVAAGPDPAAAGSRRGRDNPPERTASTAPPMAVASARAVPARSRPGARSVGRTAFVNTA